VTRLDRVKIGRRLLRGAGATGLTAGVFTAGATAFHAWNKSTGGAWPDWLILVVPLLPALAVLTFAIRAPLGRWTTLLLSFGACILVGVLAGLVMAVGGGLFSGAPRIPLLLLLGLVVAGPAVAVMLPWWNRTDEAARQAHLSGFFWGATAGGVAVVPLLMAPMLEPGSVALIARLSPEDAFFYGALTLYGAITLGYGLFWAGWWVSRSVGSEA
jgi:hypothetical protein